VSFPRFGLSRAESGSGTQLSKRRHGYGAAQPGLFVSGRVGTGKVGHTSALTEEQWRAQAIRQ
jgi:hypothetical protein